MIIPSGFAQVNWKFSGSAVPQGAEVTIGLEILVPATPAAVALAMGTAWEDWLSPHQVGTCDLTGVLVKFGPNSTGPSAEIALAVNGSASGPGLEPQVSVLIRKNTDDGGHAGRGRMYVPGFPDAAFVDGGAMDGPTWTATQADVNSFLDELVSAAYIPVLLHGAGSPLTTPSPITSLTLDHQCATQRRRNRR